MSEGYGTIVIKNPRGMHSLGVGILSRLNLIVEGSIGERAVCDFWTTGKLTKLGETREDISI